MKEQFDAKVSRLFYPDELSPVHFNGSHVYSITFQVTEDCNQNCTYCYQHNKKPNKMTFEIAKQFVDMLLEADEKTAGYIDSINTRGVILDFIGGEPFLEIELIDKICDYFLERAFQLKHPWATRYMISLCSNGLLYFDPKVQAFLNKHKNRLSLNITIDGNKELHDACRLDLHGNGTYDRAMAAVKHYTKVLGGEIGSKMTIAPENVGLIGSAVTNLLENGYDEINLNCIFEEGWTAEHAVTLYSQLKFLADFLVANDLYDKVKLSIFNDSIGHPLSPEDNMNWCGGAGLMLAVDWKGDIFPCLRYMDNAIGEKQPRFTIGTVCDGLMNTPEHLERAKCLSCITRKSQSTDECFNCPIGSGCAWCTAYNYEVTGTPNQRVTYICIMHKARVLGTAYYYKRIAEKKGIKSTYRLDIPKEWALQIIDEDEYNSLKEV